MVKRAKIFGKKDFMRLGLELAGEYKWMTYEHHCNIERFRKYYGVVPRTVGRVWNGLRTSNDESIRIYRNADPMHLLLALRFLWRYETEKDLGKFFGIKSEKTVRKWARYYVPRVSWLLPSLMPKWSDAYSGVIFWFTVDGTHCPIEEPKPFLTMWSSHKFGGSPGLNYEIALRIDKPELLWVYGPSPPGSHPDLTVFKQGLMEELRDFMEEHGVTVRGIADKGYRGVPDYLSTRNDLDPEEIAEFKNRACARQETFNQKLKMFKCLREAFRHGIEFHGQCFKAIIVLTLIQFQVGALSLFDPYTY